MVQYDDGNPGVYPLDPSTPVGQFRLVYGDTHSTPYDPVEPGFQSYDELSDDEIEAFLTAGDGSINRAIGYYYFSLAGAAAKAAKQIRDYDLQLDTTKRSADLRALGQWWFDRADDDDVIAAEEGFEIVPTGTSGGGFIPEATIPVWGRQYTIGRWR